MRNNIIRSVLLTTLLLLCPGLVLAENEGQSGHHATATLLHDRMALQRFETTPEALVFWRKFKAQQPTLLLLSNNPHLVKTPESVQDRVDELVANGSGDEIVQAGNQQRPDPLFVSAMSVDIALRNDLFKGLAWALPLKNVETEIDGEKFFSQLVRSNVATDTETAGMVLQDRIITGTLRNKPFTASVLPLIKTLEGPVLVHIDLSYFQPLYKNEISTPLLKIVSETLRTLRKMHIETLAVTFSYGHIDDQMSLDVRFLGEILAYLIEDPARLEQPVPLPWQKQAEALYLVNFFQKERITEIYQEQEALMPDAAWVKFNLFRSAVENNRGDQALAYLEQAVSLDRLYALEYLELTTMAYNAERPDEALRMLELALQAFPGNVHIRMQAAQLAIELGQMDKARSLVTQLQKHQWSTLYYPQIPEVLGHMAKIAAGAPVALRTLEDGASARRQRILHRQPASGKPESAAEQTKEADPAAPMAGTGSTSPRQRILHRLSTP